jgi:hypothetical protein
VESPPYGALWKPVTSNMSHREKAMRDPRCGTLGETLLTGSRSANDRNTSTCYPQYTFRAIPPRVPQPASCMSRCTGFDTPPSNRLRYIRISSICSAHCSWRSGTFLSSLKLAISYTHDHDLCACRQSGRTRGDSPTDCRWLSVVHRIDGGLIAVLARKFQMLTSVEQDDILKTCWILK